MNQPLIDAVNARFPLTELDPGEFARIKSGPMTFTVRAFYARGLGHVGSVEASGMLGLMRMDTLVINPRECDAPLFSYDKIVAAGKHTLLLELYDTLLAPAEYPALMRVKDGLLDIPDHDLGVHWYDGLKLPPSLAKRCAKKYADALDTGTREYLARYIDAASSAPGCDEGEKLAASASYVNGLLEHGGPSTDTFVKLLGPDKTRELFTRFVFGTNPDR